MFTCGRAAIAYWPAEDEESRIKREVFFHLSCDRLGSEMARRYLDYVAFDGGLTSGLGYDPSEIDPNENQSRIEDGARADVEADNLRPELLERLIDALIQPSELLVLLTQQLESEPDLTLDASQATTVLENAARMGTLLLPRGDGDRADFDEWMDTLTTVMIDRVPEWREFDETEGEFKVLDAQQVGVKAAEISQFAADHYRKLVWGLSLTPQSYWPETMQEAASEVRAAHRNLSKVALKVAFEPWLIAYGARLKAATDLVEAQAARQAAEADARARARPALKPEPQRYGVSPRGAEFWVCDAVRWLGAREAETTQATSDGGIDVITDDWAISVKHYGGRVPVEVDPVSRTGGCLVRLPGCAGGVRTLAG